MGVDYRKDRKKWGYQVSRHGARYKRYVWRTKDGAERAYRRLLVELDEHKPLPRNSLEAAAAQYLIESARKGRSHWRLDALRYNYTKTILPFFGAASPLEAITPRMVDNFIQEHRRGGKANQTIWHYVKDIRALFNWAIKEGLARENPVTRADLGAIRNRRAVKLPLRIEDVDAAASHLYGLDRVYFDLLRFTGLRKDEGNRVSWEDLDLDAGWLVVRGTKTPGSAAAIPLAPRFLKTLREHWERSGRPTSGYVVPGQKSKNKGKKIYSRRRMFERIYRDTGIKVRPKDLRDYFATEIAARVNDPAVVMQLLRHTNLQTTTIYLRTVRERMRAAVETLGVSRGGDFDNTPGTKTTQVDSDEAKKMVVAVGVEPTTSRM